LFREIVLELSISSSPSSSSSSLRRAMVVRREEITPPKGSFCSVEKRKTVEKKKSNEH